MIFLLVIFYLVNNISKKLASDKVFIHPVDIYSETLCKLSCEYLALLLSLIESSLLPADDTTQFLDVACSLLLPPALDSPCLINFLVVNCHSCYTSKLLCSVILYFLLWPILNMFIQANCIHNCISIIYIERQFSTSGGHLDDESQWLDSNTARNDRRSLCEVFDSIVDQAKNNADLGKNLRNRTLSRSINTMPNDIDQQAIACCSYFISLCWVLSRIYFISRKSQRTC